MGSSLSSLELADWLQAVESVGIVVSLLVAAYSILLQRRSQRVTNYMNLTAFHRDIWKIAIDRPELMKVFEVSFDKKAHQFSFEEERFLTFIFLHASSAFELLSDRNVVGLEGLRIDLADIMKLPGPLTFWERNKIFYNPKFVAYVEKAVEEL